MTALRIGLIALLVLLSVDAQAALVVCADPNNLPFSDRHEGGFENKLARLLARERLLNFRWTGAIAEERLIQAEVATAQEAYGALKYSGLIVPR